MLNGIRLIINKSCVEFVGFTSAVSDNNKYLSQMLEQLSSRGPDAEGKYFNDKINFGHKRLSIIDLNKRSNQPFYDKQSGNFIVFNGEIYNFKEIKKELIERKNCEFLTHLTPK